MKAKLILSLCAATILLLIVAFPLAKASQINSYTVSAGYVQTVSFNLDSGRTITGALSISGGSGNDINFWVTNPQGDTILNQGRVSGGTSFDFTAQSSGAYTLHFDNSFSILSSKNVVLTYDVSSPTIGGISVGLIIAISVVVAILLIVIVALAVALHRREGKSNANQPPPPPSGL